MKRQNMGKIIENQDLIESFHGEAQSLIDEMRTDLSYLKREQGKEDENPNHSQNLQNLFRCTHTIQSSSNIMGFHDLSELCEPLSNIFLRVKKENLEFSDDDIAFLFESIEVCQKLLDGEVVKHIELIGKLNNILNFRN